MYILHQNSNFASNPLYSHFVNELSQKIGDNNKILVYAPVRNKFLLNQYQDVNNHKIEYYYQRNIKKIHKLLFHSKIKRIYHDFLKKYKLKDLKAGHAPFLFTDGAVLNKIFLETGLPFIVGVKDTDLNIFFKYLFYLREKGIEILKNAKKIVFLTPSYRERLFQNYIPEDLRKDLLKKTIIIPNGIDAYWLNNRFNGRKKMDKITILSVGELCKRKNFVNTILMVDLLRKRGYPASLKIAGRQGNRTKQIMKLIKNRPWCEYAGLIQRKDDLKEFYSQGDIFVLPSFRESFGLVYGEALSQGLPVIYTRGEGFDKQFLEGEVGFSVNPYSVEDICDKTIKIIENYHEIRERTIIGAEKFSWNKIACKYSSLIAEIERS